MSSPVAGKRILVTRPRKQAGKLASSLEELGAVPLLLSTTEIQEPESFDQLDQALRKLSDFDWVVFSSVNGVEALAARMQATGIPADRLSSRKIAVVGPTTAEAFRNQFRAPDAMPEEFAAEHVAEALGEIGGLKILLPRGDKARPDLPTALCLHGATVLEIVAYRTVRTEDACKFRPQDRPDAITVASGEAARAMVSKLREAGLSSWLEDIPMACIGPVTAEALREEGFAPAIVASEFTIPGLIKALERLFEGVPAPA